MIRCVTFRLSFLLDLRAVSLKAEKAFRWSELEPELWESLVCRRLRVMGRPVCEDSGQCPPHSNCTHLPPPRFSQQHPAPTKGGVIRDSDSGFQITFQNDKSNSCS